MAKPTVNLLSKNDFTSTPWGQTLSWILNIGRWIVVITELIVIVAFLSRFKLDRDLTDLAEEISQKQAVVQSFTNFENQFRQIKSRFEVIETILAGQPRQHQVLSRTLAALPADVHFERLRIEGDNLTLNAASLSDSSIDVAVKQISEINQLKNVRLSKIKLGTRDVYISFEITAKIAHQ